MPFKPLLSKPFNHSVRHLHRKYRQVKSDLEAAIEVLLQYPKLGMVIPGTSGVRKLRIPSSDMDKGKRGGFRLLYSLDTNKSLIVLLFVYAKPQRQDLSRKEIEAIVKEALEDNVV